VTPEHFHKQFDLNVLGLLLVTQQAAKHFGAAGGSIVNISSVVAHSPVATASVYSATKAAVDAITKSLAKELGRARFASTRSTPEWSKLRASTAPASPPAISAKRLSPNAPRPASVSPTISPRCCLLRLGRLVVDHWRNTHDFWRMV